MQQIDITLDDTEVTARLLDEVAPATCQRLLEALPYEDRFTHTIWSGLMIHSNDHPELDLDVSRYPLVENPVRFLESGDVVVWPHNGTLAIAYGSSEFRWLTGPQVVTKVATIEGDIEPLIEKAARMMWEGAAETTIRRGEGKAEETAMGEDVVPAGKALEIEFDGMTWIAELYEDEVPEYCNALWDSLPLEGPITNTHSSGEILHFWVELPEAENAPEKIQKLSPVEHEGEKVGVTSVSPDPKAMRGQHPGDILWGSTWNGLRLVYGQGRFGGALSVANVPKLGRIVGGDLQAFARTAREVQRQGAKKMVIRKHAKQ